MALRRYDVIYSMLKHGTFDNRLETMAAAQPEINLHWHTMICRCFKEVQGLMETGATTAKCELVCNAAKTALILQPNNNH